MPWKIFLPPATKLGQGYVFTCVCDSVHGEGVCLSACWDTNPPPPHEQTPQEQTPTLGANIPWEQTPHRSRHPPTGAVHAGRYGQHGRYASYWNASLSSLFSLHSVLLKYSYIFIMKKGNADANCVFDPAISFCLQQLCNIFIMQIK